MAGVKGAGTGQTGASGAESGSSKKSNGAKGVDDAEMGVSSTNGAVSNIKDSLFNEAGVNGIDGAKIGAVSVKGAEQTGEFPNNDDSHAELISGTVASLEEEKSDEQLEESASAFSDWNEFDLLSLLEEETFESGQEETPGVAFRPNLNSSKTEKNNNLSSHTENSNIDLVAFVNNGPNIKIKVNDKELSVLVDTGSSKSIISENVLAEMSIPFVRQKQDVLVNVSGDCLDVLGLVSLHTNIHGICHDVGFIVIAERDVKILGFKDMRLFQITIDTNEQTLTCNGQKQSLCRNNDYLSESVFNIIA